MISTLSSKELILSPLEKSHIMQDQVFILGKVLELEHEFRVDIDSSAPLVTLNESIRNHAGLYNSPTVQEIRERKTLHDFSLISGGTYIWVTSKQVRKLVCLKRDEHASVDPDFLTGPAGRCGEKISETIENETNEELIILLKDKATHTHTALSFFFSNDNMEKHAIYKKEQVQKMLNIDCYIESIDLKKNTLQSPYTRKVTETMNGQVIDEIYNTVSFFDKTNNTLEVRIPVEVSIDTDMYEIEVWNGEDIQREVQLFTIDELKQKPLVPALKNYVSQL